MERNVKSARIKPRILAAGAGSHRRPLSRDPVPKQAINLVSNGSIFQQMLSQLASPHLAAMLGVKHVILVTTSEAVLVVPRQRTEDVKRLVAYVKGADREEATAQPRVYRPWGYYDSLET